MRRLFHQARNSLQVVLFVGSTALATTASATLLSGFGVPSDHPDLSAGQIVDFESNSSGEVANAFTFANVTMTGNQVLRILDTFDGNFNVTGNSLALTTNDRTQAVTFDFASPVAAFGFNLGGVDQIWRLIAFSTTGDVLGDLTIPAFGNGNNGEWFGISASGIASARLFNTAFDVATDTGALDYVVIDNFTQVTEPAAIALLACGLFGTRLRRPPRPTPG